MIQEKPINISSKEFAEKIRKGEIIYSNGHYITNPNYIPESPIQNKKVKNARIVRFDGKSFDSELELTFYKVLLESGYSFVLKPKIVLQPSFKYMNETIREISFIPDFQVNIHNHKIIIDTKGYPNEVFPLKLKMFKYLFFLNKIHFTDFWFINIKSDIYLAMSTLRKIKENHYTEINDKILTKLRTEPKKQYKRKKK